KSELRDFWKNVVGPVPDEAPAEDETQSEPPKKQSFFTVPAEAAEREVDGPRGTDQTALMLAARSNIVAALKVLVKNGADVSLPCKLKWAGGRTADGLAELEKQRAALAYLRGAFVPDNDGQRTSRCT